ncbi:unnamed protein product, partial [Linum tenue]
MDSQLLSCGHLCPLCQV